MSSSRRHLFRNAAKAAARAAAKEAAPAREPEQPSAPEGILGDEQQVRYSRQLVLPGWGEAEQLRVRNSSVLVIGAGALGSPVAAYLVGAGVGRVGIVDDDVVDVSNLHRQHLHFNPDVGTPKAHSAVDKLRLLNPDVEVEPYQVRFDADVGHGLVAGHDLVVDCSDSFDTRYAVNAVCCSTRVDLVEGGVVGVTGLVMAIRPGRTSCYRCAFPAPPPPSAQPTCAEEGVLGPAAGVIGSLQALEALRLLAGLPTVLTNGFLQVDLSDASFLRVAAPRDPDCPDCG